jgi:hypothetical protein
VKSAPRFTRIGRFNRKNTSIELMDGQHFSNSSVVVENERTRVGLGIEIPHPGF